MATPKQIAPGLYHWTAVHPRIHVRVSSYYLVQERVLIDPLLPGVRGMEWLGKRGPPEHIYLTNRLHSRHSAQLVAKFACTVWCHRSGLDNLAPELRARPYDWGNELPGSVRVIEVGTLCPDESALLLPTVRAAAVADGVVRRGNGPLTFVPDELLVDDVVHAARVKHGLKAAYLKLAQQDFDHLLLAHGNPWIRDGRTALLAWAHSNSE
jgi:hypothetical protein